MTYMEAYLSRFGMKEIGERGYPAGCVVKSFGRRAQSKYCVTPNSPLRCEDCWERQIEAVQDEKEAD